jgi:hypothetical protein
VYSSSLKTFSWHYYHISADAGESLTILVNQTSKNGDVDVYIKLGSYPTGTDYDQMDDTESTNIVMEISPTDSGVYYVGLYGYWDVSYNVSLTLEGNYLYLNFTHNKENDHPLDYYYYYL